MSRAQLQDPAQLGRPLTAEEREYLHNRSLDWKIAENERRYGKARPEVDLVVDDKPIIESVPAIVDERPVNQNIAPFPVPPEVVDQINAFSPAELKAELKLRGITMTGNQNELRERLINAYGQTQE